MLNSKQKCNLNNNKGMAILETLPILIVIVLLFNFSIGFFGAIHTGILSSISARNYAFETFRNKADLVYMRESPKNHFEKSNNRQHVSMHEKYYNVNANPTTQVGPDRKIDFFDFSNRAADIVDNNIGAHDKIRNLPDGRVTTSEVNPIWVKVGYGICLNNSCGD